jgi:hypothetical protein
MVPSLRHRLLALFVLLVCLPHPVSSPPRRQIRRCRQIPAIRIGTLANGLPTGCVHMPPRPVRSPCGCVWVLVP